MRPYMPSISYNHWVSPVREDHDSASYPRKLLKGLVMPLDRTNTSTPLDKPSGSSTTDFHAIYEYDGTPTVFTVSSTAQYIHTQRQFLSAVVGT